MSSEDVAIGSCWCTGESIEFVVKPREAGRHLDIFNGSSEPRSKE